MTDLKQSLYDAHRLLQRDGWSPKTKPGGSRSITDALADVGLRAPSTHGRIARTLVIKAVSRRFRPAQTVEHLWAWEADPDTTQEQALDVVRNAAEAAGRLALK